MQQRREAEEEDVASSSSSSDPNADHSSSSFLLCLPPISSLNVFQAHNRPDETAARIAAFAAASLALPHEDGSSEARAKIPKGKQVHAALLRLLECGGLVVCVSASPATTPRPGASCGPCVGTPGSGLAVLSLLGASSQWLPP